MSSYSWKTAANFFRIALAIGLLAGCSSQSGATCADRVRNAGEGDIDCGGGCGPCADGLGCDAPGDCQSQVCENTICAAPRCGDGVVNQASEVCDGGDPSATCDVDCTAPLCGDGYTNTAAGEQCDDGNTLPGDGCDATCGIENLPPIPIVTGEAHTCALDSAGAVRCWGQGNFGQLGHGNTSDIGDDELPSVAGTVDVGGSVVQLAAGRHHTCALLDTGALRCWGYNLNGQLGYGHTQNIGDDELPSSAGDVALGGTAVQVTAGGFHTCALLDTGALRCWGWNASGTLGYGHTSDIGDDELPSSAGDVALGGTAVQVTAGGFHTCARLDTGALRCWGYNLYGQLGYGHTQNIGDDELPSSAGPVSLGGTATQLTSNLFHTCALLSSGALRCWGYNQDGRLGYGHTSHIGDDELPASAGDVSVGGAVTRLAAGMGTHTCARLATGAVRCWGSNYYGQLGHGHTQDIGDDELPSSAGDVPYQ